MSMERLFYKKKTAILAIALAVVLVFLVCLLLVTLPQLTSLKALKNNLKQRLKDVENDAEAKNELLEYQKTNQYVIEWAEKMGYFKNDEDITNWLQSSK